MHNARAGAPTKQQLSRERPARGAGAPAGVPRASRIADPLQPGQPAQLHAHPGFPAASHPHPWGSARRCASPLRPRAAARAPPKARARPRPALLRAGRGGGAVPRRPSSAPPAPLMNIDVSPPRDVAAVPGREPEPPRCWPRGRMRERRQAPSRLPARRLAPQPAGAAQGAASRVEGRRRGGDAAALRGAGGAAAAAAVAAGAAARAAGLSARRQRQVPGRAGRVSLGTRRGRAWLRLPARNFSDRRCGAMRGAGRSAAARTWAVLPGPLPPRAAPRRNLVAPPGSLHALTNSSALFLLYVGVHLFSLRV